MEIPKIATYPKQIFFLNQKGPTNQKKTIWSRHKEVFSSHKVLASSKIYSKISTIQIKPGVPYPFSCSPVPSGSKTPPLCMVSALCLPQSAAGEIADLPSLGRQTCNCPSLVAPAPNLPDLTSLPSQRTPGVWVPGHQDKTQCK